MPPDERKDARTYAWGYFALHGRKLMLIPDPDKTYYVVAGYRPERSWAFPLAGDSVEIKQITEDDARPLRQQFKAP